MNVLIKVELPDDAIIPDVDEITLGDENRNCKVVAVIPEPYFLQYTKGDTQVLDGCTIQLTDDSVNPITVQSPEQQKIQNKAFNLINRIDRAVTETLRMMGYPILDLKMGTVERILSEPTEQVNHPDHYNAYPIEVIDMMAEIFSVEAAIEWCHMTAFKYRMRMGLKGDVSQDLKKEQWYLDKAKELEDAQSA